MNIQFRRKSFMMIVFLQFLLTMASAQTEQQKYKVIQQEKDYEIRFYPSATLATIYSEADTYKELSGSGFRKLADYIFGDNETEVKISMTAPVHMDINDTRSSMSFVMPSKYNPENLPKPKDSGIKIEKSKDEYVAAIRFTGYASDSDIKKYSEKLKKLLDEKGILYYGNFRFLGYNSPFDMFGRRNEIIVSVKWQEE